MDDTWTRICEDYNKAKSALWYSKHMEHWSRDVEKGYYYMWKAYQEAKKAITKDHLTYARILAMVSSESRYHFNEYERLHKYVIPALDEYRRAVESGQHPTEKELKIIQREYDALFYQESCVNAPFEEQIKNIHGYEKLEKFGFYDSQLIAFQHSEHQAELKLQLDSMIVTLVFDDVYEIFINADPAVIWITEFSCYSYFYDKSMIIFDIGDYRIKCKSISVKSVEYEPPYSNV